MSKTLDGSEDDMVSDDLPSVNSEPESESGRYICTAAADDVGVETKE